MSYESITSPVNDLFTLYRADVMRYPRLTPELTREHARNVYDGIQILRDLNVVTKFSLPELIDTTPDKMADAYELDMQSRQALGRAYESCDTLIISNLRYVIKLAGPYAKATGQPIMDIIQEGNLGLAQAVRKYDYRKGFAFTTYADSWIRQAMKRGVDNTDAVIRIPVHMQQSISNLRSAEQTVAAESNEVAPSIARLAVVMSTSEDKVRQVMRARSVAHTESLSRPTSHDSERTLEDTIADTSLRGPEDALDAVTAEGLSSLVHRALAENPDLLETITRSFGVNGHSPQTDQEIASDFGLTHQAISLRNKRAIKLIREYAEFYGFNPGKIDG